MIKCHTRVINWWLYGMEKYQGIAVIEYIDIYRVSQKVYTLLQYLLQVNCVLYRFNALVLLMSSRPSFEKKVHSKSSFWNATGSRKMHLKFKGGEFHSDSSLGNWSYVWSWWFYKRFAEETFQRTTDISKPCETRKRDGKYSHESKKLIEILIGACYCILLCFQQSLDHDGHPFENTLYNKRIHLNKYCLHMYHWN